MKKSLLLLGFISYLCSGQITDENGNSAASSNGTTLSGGIKIGTTNTSSTLEVFGIATISEGGASEAIVIGRDFYGGELGMMTTEDDIMAIKFNNRFEYGGGIPGSGRLVVTQAGNVGIGTINPAHKLDVFGLNALALNGYAIADVNNSNGIIKIGDVDGNDAQLALYDNSTSEIVRIANGRVGIGTTTPSFPLDIFGSNALAINGHAIADVDPFNGIIKLGDVNGNYAKLALYDNFNNEIIRVANGNVGIGTTNPYSKLDVLGTAYIGDDVSERIQVGVNMHGDELGIMTTEDDILAVKHYDRFEYGGGAPGSGRLVVTQAGNVGIGTINPDEKLSVNGTIHSKEVRVDLIGWPDYVFDDNYDLPSLKDVEKYIKENGHLENIQSAVEVEKNGILLGEMNKKLLEKIEELTLYLIQQNKDIEELKKQVEFLKQKQ